MFKAILGILGLLIPVAALAHNPTLSNKLTIGDKAASDKSIVFDKGAGASNPALKWNNSTSKLQFSNNGSDFSDFGSGDGGGGAYNYVTNPSAATGVADWTETDADNDASWARDTSNTFQGNNSFAYDAADNVDKVCADLNTVSGSFIAEASLWYKGDASLYELEIQDGSGNTLTEVDLTNESDWREAYLIYPATAGVKVCVVSTGDGAAINFTKVYYGTSSRVGLANVITDWTSYTPTWGGGTPSIGNGTLSGKWRRVGDTMEVEIGMLAGSTTTFGSGGWTFSLPSGYTINTSKLSDTNSARSIGIAYARDAGTAIYHHRVSYNDATTVQAVVATSGAYFSSSQPFTWGSGDHLTLKFSVPITGWIAQTAVTVDTSGGSWSGYTGDAGTACDFSVSQSTYAGDFPADADCTLTERTNKNFGVVTGDNKSITFTPKITGMMKVDAVVAVQPPNNVVSACRLIAGSTVIAESPLKNVSSNIPVPLMGEYDITSLAPQTIKLQCLSASGAVEIYSGGAAPEISWRLANGTQNLPAPILQNQVSTSAAGGVRVESATLAAPSASACAVTEVSGDWINGNATSSGTGVCALTFNTGMFSAPPACTATARSTGRVCMPSNAAPSATGITLSCFDATSGGSASNAGFDIICTGPR